MTYEQHDGLEKLDRRAFKATYFPPQPRCSGAFFLGAEMQEFQPNSQHPPTLSLSDDARTHYSSEQQTLGVEKNDIIKGVESDRTFAIVASGAVWAWYATNPLQGSLRVLYVLPLGISLLFVLKRFAANAAIDQIGKYIRNMEKRLLPDQSRVPIGYVAGWETWLQTKSNRIEWYRRYDIVFWIAICGGNLLLALTLWLR